MEPTNTVEKVTIIQIMDDKNDEYQCIGLGSDSMIYGYNAFTHKWESI